MDVCLKWPSAKMYAVYVYNIYNRWIYTGKGKKL